MLTILESRGNGCRVRGRLTLVQPVGEAVEDDAFFPRGNQADRSVHHRRPVEDVVFKYEDLEREKVGRGKNLPLVSVSPDAI